MTDTEYRIENMSIEMASTLFKFRKIEPYEAEVYGVPDGSIQIIQTINTDQNGNLCIPDRINDTEVTLYFGMRTGKKLEINKLYISKNIQSIVSLYDINVHDEIIVDNDNKVYASNGTFLLSKDGLKLYHMVVEKSEFCIPEGVQIIGERAFYWNKKIKEVEIPDSVECIESQAFSNSSLECILLSEYISSLSKGVFENCDKLKVVKLSNSIKVLNDRLFYGCKLLQKIVLPLGLERIGSSVFQRSGLVSISIPQSVLQMDLSSFIACNNLKQVHISKELVTKLCSEKDGYGLFEGTHIVEQYLFEGDNQELEALIGKYLNNKQEREEYLSLAIRRKDSVAVSKILGLQKRKVSLKEIDKYIEMATQRKDASVIGEFLSYKHKCYSNERIQELEQDQLDKELGMKERTVADWRKIYQLSIIDATTLAIAKYKGKDRIIEIPDRIGDYNVVRLKEKAFKNCNFIEEIHISETVKVIERHCFENCKKIKQIYIQSNEIDIHPAAFDITKKINITGGTYITMSCLGNNYLVQNNRQEHKFSINQTETGNQLIMGYFPQGEYGEVEPIVWEIVEIKENQMTLVSHNILLVAGGKTNIRDKKICNISDGKIEKWLKKDFYQFAFDETEKNKIISIRLPRREEIEKMAAAGIQLKVKGSSYTRLSNDIYANNNLPWWLGVDHNEVFWMESTGKVVSYNEYAKEKHYIDYIELGIRPVMTIKITKKEIQKE